MPPGIERAHQFGLIGDFAAALQSVEEHIRAHPNDAGGYACKSNVLHHMGRSDEALQCWDRVKAVAPKYSIWHFRRGQILLDMGRYDEAIAEFTRQAARDDPDQLFGPASYLYRAECHLRLGQYGQALADCAMLPEDFEIPGFRGRLDGSKKLIIDDIARIRGDIPSP